MVERAAWYQHASPRPNKYFPYRKHFNQTWKIISYVVNFTMPKKATEPADPIISTAEAAKLLALTPHRVTQLIRAGILPAQQIGRGWAVRVSDLGKARARSTKKTGRPRSIQSK